MPPPLLALAAAMALAGCAPRAPAPLAPTDRISAECALLAEAARLHPPLHAGALEDCPGIAARDIRPLAEQMASLRAATAAALPAGVRAGSRGETVFRRLITRGVPPGVAAELTTRPDFARAAG